MTTYPARGRSKQLTIHFRKRTLAFHQVLADRGRSNSTLTPGSLESSPQVAFPGLTAAGWVLIARHMVYDPVRDRLYLTTTGSAAAYPNSVITVDPGTGAVVSSIWVGSQPSVLALSDDASTLWVGLAGLAAIRKISLSSGGAPVLGPLCRFPLDQNKIDYLRPGDVVVLPGAPESVVVVRSSTWPDDITVLDDCVARPTQVSHTNTAPPLIFRGPPGYLFGLNGSMNAIAVLPVDSSGITRQDVTGLIGMETQSSGFYHNGLIYMSGGEVVDVTNIASPARTGAFAFQGPIAPLNGGHVMMLNASQLRVLSVDTFTLTAVAENNLLWTDQKSAQPGRARRAFRRISRPESSEWAIV